MMAEYIEREGFLDYAEARYCLPCETAGKDHLGVTCLTCWVANMRGELIGAPAANVVPVSELVELRDWLYDHDQITLLGLGRLNRLIAKYGGDDDGEAE